MEPQKLACIVPILESDWESRTPEQEEFWDSSSRAEMEKRGTLTSEITRTVAPEAIVDGHRLFEQWEGEPLPPLVLLRYEAMAIPNEEVLNGGS